MKALTISQPYASLIADGEKYIENRTWETKYRGLIAIHAGKGTQYLTAAEMRSQELPTGQIVAVAELVECLEIGFIERNRANTEPLAELLGLSVQDMANHEHTEGPWCWVLQHVRKISTAIEATGALGLWVVPSEVEELIMSDADTAVADPEVVDVEAGLEDEAAEQLDSMDDQEAEEAVPLSELERSHYDEIRTLEIQASESEEEFDIASAQAKALKKRWEGKVEVLRSVIRRGVDDQQRLPFGDDDEDMAGPEDAWKIVAVGDVLELTDKQAEMLKTAGILTVEHFENLRAGDGITSLPRIGEAIADKWEDQMLDWLAENAREGNSGREDAAGDGEAPQSESEADSEDD